MFVAEVVMTNFLSDSLIQISNMMMVASERREIIHLAGELNQIIEKTVEIERLSQNTLPTPTRKTLSSTISFTQKETDMMSKTFRKEFILNGMVTHIIKRPSGRTGAYYEIRYRRNGYNITVSHKDLKMAKQLFIQETHKLETPEERTKSKMKFGAILNEWLNYKKGKITDKTVMRYQSLSKRFISDELKAISIQDIRTSHIDGQMNQVRNDPRLYEDLRTVFNSTFRYAKASGIITYNPIEMIPFKRAERENRDRLTDDEVISFLTRLKEPHFDRIRNFALAIYFFGLRPCEIDREARFENGFLIARNRKRKNGKIEYKKIPIPQQAYGLIDFDIPLKSPLSYNQTLRLLKKALGENKVPYQLRHTFASICYETVKAELVNIWMGDAPDKLVGKTYVHWSDNFMRKQMDTVKFIMV